MLRIVAKYIYIVFQTPLSFVLPIPCIILSQTIANDFFKILAVGYILAQNFFLSHQRLPNTGIQVPTAKEVAV